MPPSLATPLVAEMVVDAIAANFHDEGRIKTLRVCRLVTRTMHDRASYHLFRSVDILSTGKFVAAYDTLLHSTGVTPYCTALTIGCTTRPPPHTPSPPLPVVHHGVLVDVIRLLPNLEFLKIGAVEEEALFFFPSRSPGSGDAPSSYAAVLASEGAATNPLSTQSMRVVVPPSTTWAGAAQAGTIVGHPTAYANIFRLDESDLPYALDAALPRGSSVVALYGGSMDAFIAFGTLLLSLGGSLHNLSVSWTAAHTLHHCGEMAEALRHGISACGVLRHLALGLFVGSTALVSLPDQWRAIISLLAAANPATLRTFTLAITIHEDASLDEHLFRFESLEWFQARRLVCPRWCTSFEAVQFKVVGARPEVVERIEWVLRHGLGHGCPVRRSCDPVFVVFF